MKRNIIRNLFPALIAALVVVSCQVDTVTESTVVTRLEKNVYEVGENVRFHFSGEADFVTIFTGVDNYNGGTMGGTIKGSRYIYRNRGRENGSPVLSFNCKKDGDNLEEYAEIKLLLSTDFDGDITMEGIKRATWLDISEKAKWPVEGTKKGVNVNSGAIDLSEWNGRDIYLAFRYTAKRDRNRKDIQSLHSILIIQLKRMLFLIRYGQMLLLQNVVQLRINCRKIRPVLFSPLISGHLEHRLLVQACLTVRRILKAG